MKRISKQSAFTLVELTIVLVIIGLLVGGVLQGQELIKQAKIRSQIAQLEDINLSVNSFRSKYDALPGDFKDATKFWGVLTNTDTDDWTGNTNTVDGNGNGVVEDLIGATYENMSIWRHLANAGLINETFTGAMNTNYTDLISMKAKLSNDLRITLLSNRYLSDRGYLEPTISKKGYSFLLGGKNGAEDAAVIGSVISPENAQSFDIKLDDGKPASGRVSSERQFCGPTCCRDSSDPPEYDILTPTNKCALIVGANF